MNSVVWIWLIHSNSINIDVCDSDTCIIVRYNAEAIEKKIE